MTGAAAAAASSLPSTTTAVEAAVATAVSAAAANSSGNDAAARSGEIDRLDRLVEMASQNNHHPPNNVNTSAGGNTSANTGGGDGGRGSSSSSPFLVPRNPRDTVLTSGSPKRRIAAVHAQQQQQQMQMHASMNGTSSSRQHHPNHITAATSLGNGSSSNAAAASARRTHSAVSGASSLGGLGNGSNMMMPPPPPLQPTSARSTPTNASHGQSQSHRASAQSQNQGHGGGSRIILPPSLHAQSRRLNASDPDAEEQAMFESRLCEDEYGVAVRKINHNGKSQLRYVRCVWLPSSEMVIDALALGGGDGISPSSAASGAGGGGGAGSPNSSPNKKAMMSQGGAAASSTASMNSFTTGGNGGGGGGGGGGRRGRGRARPSMVASGGNSVSSLMGRMVSAGRSRGRSLSRDPSVRRSSRNGGGGTMQVPPSSASSLSQNGGDPPKVVVEGPISSPGMAVHDDERDEDEARLLETRPSSSLPLGLGGGDGGVVGDIDPANPGAMSTKRMRALTWGNKKKVRIPLNRFVCVRKGETTDRTKRNGHSASRLLSLITDDPANPSLDIEAPTKLDRDKFARAFARFLEVPLAAEEGGKSGGSGGQRRSAAAATVADGRPGECCLERSLLFCNIHGLVTAIILYVDLLPFSFRYDPPPDSKSYRGNRMSKKFISSAVSAPDLNSPTSVLSGSATQSFSNHTNGGTSAAAAASLLPPIQAAASGDDDGRMSFATGSIKDASAASESKGPSLGGYIGNVGTASSASGRRPFVGAGQSMSSSNAGVVHSMAGSSNALLSDAAIKRIEAEGEADDAALLFNAEAAATPRKDGAIDDGNNKSLLPQASAVGAATAAPTNQAVSPSIKIDHHHHHHDQHNTHHHHGTTGEQMAEEGTVVSSLTQGFDQEIVEELHQALTELRAELEASRAEAARAVKVAEQAIQSAESCSSSDWNSTVTHKAAEAAAQAQKKSAEALAKQRLAEERLASERKSAQYWRQQAEAAEQEAGLLTTRAVVAEVQKAEIEATLESERRKNAVYVASLKGNYESSDGMRKAALADATERNRFLEIELNGTRTDLASRSEEAKMLQDTLSDVTSTGSKPAKGKKKSFSMGRKKGHVRGNSLLSGDASSVTSDAEIMLSPSDNLSNGQLTQLDADTKSMRHQLEVLRRTTVDELNSLPGFAQEWVGRAAAAVEASQTEARVLREKLAMESSMRKKLLNEVQDMKGNVRVYCRPQPRLDGATVDIASVPSSNVIVLHRDLDQDASNEFGSPAPMSFEFDRVFSPESNQKEIYSEVEELALGALDGFNICLMAYGQDAAGKRRTILGDYEVSLVDPEAPSATILHQGIHFLAAQQLFTVAEHRADRFQDCFTINIVEVHDDKLRDLLAGTRIAEESGQVQINPPKSSKKKRGADDGSASASKTGSNKYAGTRLEIRTNYDGDTVVQGAITVEVKSFNDLCRVWQECLIERSARLAEQSINEDQYLAECHVIATLSVVSTNVSTGIGTSGKIQFVDLASSDLQACYVDSDADAEPFCTPTDGVLSGVGNNSQWKYANKSLETLLDVVTARSQFSRSVPYRNSTLTHLLRDSFTSDTKFLFLASVSTDAEDLQNTASALRFASMMRKVNVGIATKHTVSLA